MNKNMVSGWDVLDGAHRALREAVTGVPSGSWDRPTPCENWTVTQVLQHAALDQLAYAAAITGGPWPTEDAFAPSGHLDEAPQAVLERALEASAGGWATVDRDAPETPTPTPLPLGHLPAWLGAGACALDAAVHAWDIAVATGQPSPLTPALAGPLLTAAQNIVEPLRAYGAYAPALELPGDGDGEVAALLRYLGRRPDWTP